MTSPTWQHIFFAVGLFAVLSNDNDHQLSKQSQKAAAESGARMMLPTVVEQAVLRLIQSKAATSQIELARALKLRPNTVHGIVKRLMADGFISTEKTVRGSRGRPSLHFTITLPGKVLVIQLLGTEWRGAIIGANREQENAGVVTMHSSIFSDLTESRSFFLQIRDRALAGANCRLEELQGIMVSTNAVKRPESGLLSSSVTPWISELSEDYLTKLLGAPTLVSTQGKLAELELRTWTRDGIRSLVRFNVGDGASSHYASLFGPASMAESFPGEIGHVQRKTGGEICGCGNRGCLETLIAGPRMLRRLRLDLDSGLQTVLRKSADKSPAEFFQDLYLADQEGQDAYARTLATEFLEHCAWGLSISINMFRPQLVVLDGYALAGHPLWLNRLESLLPGLVLNGGPTDYRLVFSRQKPLDLILELAAEFFMRQKGIAL